MAIFKLMLGALLALLAIITIAFFIPGSSAPTAAIHPQIDSMLKSSGGYAGKPGTLFLAFGIGLLMISIMSLAVLAGWRKAGSLGKSGKWLIAGCIGFVGVFCALTFTYWQYANGISDTFIGGFPLPTAWMLYGMWPFPLILLGIFIYNFDRWFLTEPDLAQFQSLLAARQSESEKDS